MKPLAQGWLPTREGQAGVPAWLSASSPHLGEPPVKQCFRSRPARVVTGVSNAATSKREDVPRHGPFCGDLVVWDCKAFSQNSQTLEETLGMTVFPDWLLFNEGGNGPAPLPLGPV